MKPTAEGTGMLLQVTPKRFLLFISGVVVATGGFVAWVRLRNPVDAQIAALAKAEGVPVSQMDDIMRIADELSSKHTIRSQEWQTLDELAQDRNRMTRYEAFNAMGFAYRSPYEANAVSAVRRMKRDPNSSIRALYYMVLFRLHSSDAPTEAQLGMSDHASDVREGARAALELAESRRFGGG